MQGSSITPATAAPPTAPLPSRPCHCIIKLGGSAITQKHVLETLKPDVLQHICGSVKQLYSSTAGGVVLVHGAGSFGHFQASEYKVAQGGRDKQSATTGFVQTRRAVTLLNHHVVSALAAAGVPAVGLSPCGVWTTADRQPVNTAAGVQAVRALLDSGMVPVLHGDCVLDIELGVTILSGDTIIRVLAEALHPQYCVFLTDVAGLHTAPPDNNPDAVLIPCVDVHSDGSWSLPAAADTHHTAGRSKSNSGSADASVSCVQLSVAAHDTTGGIAAKVTEAAGVVVAGCPVVIVQAGTAAETAAVLHGPTAISQNSSSGSGGDTVKGTVLRMAAGIQLEQQHDTQVM